MFKKKILLIFIIIISFFPCMLFFNSYSYAKTSAFPSKYDLRIENRLTPVKEQGGIGSCWSLSSIASLESRLKTLENIDYDLSENNMITQLSNCYTESFDRNPASGGDNAIATSYYASWAGPVLEKDDSYSSTKKAEDIKIRTGIHTAKHVQEVIFLPERKNPLDNELFKSHIMKYGAISASMWKGTPQTFGEFYNEDTFSWFYPYSYMNKEGHGHAINIVGWDDNYPKENFKITPEGNGAFIAQNTKGPFWGQLNRENNMGGFFYISYYDMMIGTKLDDNIGNSVITRVDDIDNYDHIYQYDTMGYTKPYKLKRGRSVWFANNFKILDKPEQLKAVSFYTLEENLNYSIYIIEDFSNSFSNMKKLISGNISLPGYHTIDIDKELKLKAKTNVLIVVNLESKDRTTPTIATESPNGILSSKAISKARQSYIKNNSWKDLYSIEPNTNVCLKIFTDDYAPEKEAFISVEDMKTDVDFLIQWTLTHDAYAKTYGYTKEQQEIINYVYSQITKPKTKNEFYFIINRLFTMMNEGHTSCHPQQNLSSELFLNIPFKWLNEGMIVNKSLDGLKSGDKILCIGGKTVDEIEKLFKQQISCENKYWLHYYSHTLINRYDYLNHFNLINDDDTVDLLIQRDNKQLVLKKGFDYNRKFDSTSYIPNASDATSEYHIEQQNNLGYFRFDQWYQEGEDLDNLKKEIDDFFKQISTANIDNIVFDLRNNPGGCAQIMNHFLRYINTGTIYGTSNYPYTKGNDKFYEHLFDGNVYILTSNNTFSCSVYGTTILKDNNIAKTIGEPTGENPAFNKHGSGSDGKLPKTKWRFMMTSSLGSRPFNKDISEIAIFPDYPVYTTKSDLLSGRDIQLERLRQITSDMGYDYCQKSLNLSPTDKIKIIKDNDFYIDEENTIHVDGNINKIWIEDTLLHEPIDVTYTNGDQIILSPIKDTLLPKTFELNISTNHNVKSILVTPINLLGKNSSGIDHITAKVFLTKDGALMVKSQLVDDFHPSINNKYYKDIAFDPNKLESKNVWIEDLSSGEKFSYDKFERKSKNFFYCKFKNTILDPNKQYALVINDSKDIDLKLLVSIIDEQLDFNIIPQRTGYSLCKFGYIVIKFNKPIKYVKNSYKTIVTDQNGTRYRCHIEKAITPNLALIMIKKNIPKENNYYFEIPAGTIISVDDDVYNEVIESDFIVGD